MQIKKIGVLGAGTMGSGIAQTAAKSGFEVYMIDVKEEFVAAGITRISKNLQKSVDRGKLSLQEKDDILDRIIGTVGISNLPDVDLVIEAVVENIEIKKKVYAELEQICPPHCILASNTSALSITEIAAATKRPDKVIGLHFFNPAPVMKLVEIIPGLVTSAETVARMTELGKSLDKTPVVTKESPGFIVNRILIPMINEAALTYQEGVASAADVDNAMKLGAGMPMGPLALADLIGIDVVLAIMEVFCNEFADSKYRPALILKQLVRAGHLGVKSGRGFYEYNN